MVEMPAKDKLLALAVVVAWALNLIVIKVGLTEIPPIFMSALRFALVAALIIPFTRITRAQLPWIAAVSITFGGMHFGLLFVALSMAEAGTSAVLVQLGAPIATVLACLFFGERLGLVRLGGIVLAVFGICVLAAGPSLPGPLPLALLGASATGWAVTNILVKAMPKDVTPITMTGWSSLVAVPQLLLASALFESGQWHALTHAGWHGWLAVVYSAVISSILAYGIWYWLLQRHPISSVVPWSMLTPLVAVLLGILLLDDTPAPVKLAGVAIIVAGVALVIRQPTPLVGDGGEAAG